MNLFKGLMFLEGHFTRLQDIDDDFAALGDQGASRQRRRGQPVHGLAPVRPAAPRWNLLQHLQLLGGRPMHAGHNLDLGEPFEQLAPANHDVRECVACG